MKIVISSSLKMDAMSVNSCIRTVESDIKKIETLLSELPNYWKGKDADSFVSKYQEANTELQKYVKEFYNYSDFLSKVYGVFNALEEAYNKPISTD